MAEISADKLLQIIGQKEVELMMLREQLQIGTQENEKLKTQINTDGKKSETIN